MAKINLLPWRQERRKQRQTEFVAALAGSAIGAVLLVFLIVQYHNGQIEGQQARNALLQQEIQRVDQQIREIETLEATRDQLIARKEVIEQLQASRSQMVHLFDELVRTIPDGVQLTSIRQSGPQLTLEGHAQSNARVSAYMRNIERSEWMTNPDLSIIQARGGQHALPFDFTLRVQMATPGQNTEEFDEVVALTAGGAR
jgi:type IV pilus assembly protein PilN